MQQAQLDRHRERLLKLHDRLQDDIRGITERLPEKMTAPGEVSTLGTHNADHDTEGLDAEIALEQNQEAIFAEVQQALFRIDEGTYGTCVSCGGKIAEERLKALPYTPYCTACAHQHEQIPR